METGARLFLYTDGLTEANNAENEMFGEERILQELNREGERTPEEILQGMSKAVNGFVQQREAFDDLTMMCLNYNGPKDTAERD